MNASTNKEIYDVLINKIIPLLEEYFYDDIQKVRFVLNENDDTTYPFYIEDIEAKEAYDVYVSNGDIEEEEKHFYVLSDNATTEEDFNNYLKHLLGVSES